MTDKWIFLSLFLCMGQAFANNIEISNVSLTGQNTSNQTVRVQFDVSWENSWRISVGPANWDAAWIFIKYRQTGGAWGHATLNYVNGNAVADGHTPPAGSTTRTSPDGKGIFIYRSADGSGNVNFSNVQLRWNYGVDGVADGDLVDVQVFGVEMVHVPQGNFFVGSGAGGTEVNKFYNWPFGGAYQISSENALLIGPSIGRLYYGNAAGSNGAPSRRASPKATMPFTA